MLAKNARVFDHWGLWNFSDKHPQATKALTEHLQKLASLGTPEIWSEMKCIWLLLDDLSHLFSGVVAATTTCPNMCNEHFFEQSERSELSASLHQWHAFQH